jgi:hypothetical protein
MWSWELTVLLRKFLLSAIATSFNNDHAQVSVAQITSVACLFLTCDSGASLPCSQALTALLLLTIQLVIQSMVLPFATPSLNYFELMSLGAGCTILVGALFANALEGGERVFVTVAVIVIVAGVALALALSVVGGRIAMIVGE